MTSQLDCVKRILKHLKVPIGKLSLDKNNIVVQNAGSQTVTGFCSIILLALQQTQTDLKFTTPLEELQVRQWLEYAATTFRNIRNVNHSKAVLEEFNNVLKLRTFLVGFRITVIDLVLFYLIAPTMCNLNPQEKVQFINVCRWYDHIQQNISIRQELPFVNFSSNYVLYMNQAKQQNLITIK